MTKQIIRTRFDAPSWFTEERYESLKNCNGADLFKLITFFQIVLNDIESTQSFEKYIEANKLTIDNPESITVQRFEEEKAAIAKSINDWFSEPFNISEPSKRKPKTLQQPLVHSIDFQHIRYLMALYRTDENMLSNYSNDVNEAFGYQCGYVYTDLTAPDEQLIESFKAWLEEARSKDEDSDPSYYKKYSDINKILEYGVIQALELRIWGALFEIRITNDAYGDLLFQGFEGGLTERYRKVTGEYIKTLNLDNPRGKFALTALNSDKYSCCPSIANRIESYMSCFQYLE